MTEYMHYRGRMVEVFARTPTGQPIPGLDDDVDVDVDVDGESVGDFAFIRDKAMQWNGIVWTPSPWKYFAVWKIAT